MSTSVPLVMVLSGATLSGGVDESTGSTVGLVLIDVKRCDLLATATPSYQIRAKAVNQIEVVDSEWGGASTGSYADFRECSTVRLINVRNAQRLEMHFDSASPFLPMLLATKYKLYDTQFAGDFNSFLEGASAFEATQTSFGGSTTLSGDRSWSFRRCTFGPLAVGGLAPDVVLGQCVRGVLTGGGVGSLAESKLFGEATFVASLSETVTFEIPMPNTDYQVLPENDVIPVSVADLPVIQNKTLAGFDIEFGVPQTRVVRYVVYRDV